MSRRELIQMTDDEARSFLAEELVVVCATNGRDGWPHLMPLWFVMRGHREPAASGTYEPWSWTYARSQKVRNLERDARATLQFESGEQYDQLRGVMLKCDVVVHREVADVEALGVEIMSRYSGGAGGEAVEQMVAAQAPKRVGLQFVERERSTWDHRKLGGAY
jgi:general stress protein 26